MKILVTGGAGFIASNIADAYINLGHEVVIIDNLSTGNIRNINPKAKFYQKDITSDKILRIFEEEKFDIISHHAAQMNVRFSVENPIFDANVNILGGLNLYEAARKTGVRKIIFASTGGAIYGDSDIIPTPETAEQNPCSPYGISKLSNEKFLYFYKQNYGLDFVCLRYANVFGPRQNPFGEAGVVAIFANKMLKNEQPFINGDGLYTRDYVFIEDVVRANILATGDNFSGIFNIGTSIETTTNQVFHAIKKYVQSDCEEKHLEAKAGEQRRSCISYEKINRQFGWQPETDFEHGIQKTVNFFKNS